MNKGSYYIGDLSYVLEKWDEIIFLNKIKNNEYTIKNGGNIACFAVNIDNPIHEDQFGQIYKNKSGFLGCIQIEDIDYVDADLTNGQIVQFYDTFTTWESMGRILFGHICINTK